MLDLEKLNSVIENAEDKLYNWQTQSDADKIEASIDALPDVDRLTLEDEGAVNAVMINDISPLRNENLSISCY